MADILGDNGRGSLIVVSAPAGTGKSTLVDRLLKEFPRVRESLSSTTRLPREGEKDGLHYHFTSKEDFEARIAEGDFLEYAQVFGNYYGTSQTCVEELRAQGYHIVFVIDTQGALQLRARCPEATLVFIRPPSMEELRRRLVERQTEAADVIETRLRWAEHELAAAEKYDYIFTNSDLNVAYQVLRGIVIAEAHRQSPLQRFTGPQQMP